jgi:hypothetical protein
MIVLVVWWLAGALLLGTSTLLLYLCGRALVRMLTG